MPGTTSTRQRQACWVVTGVADETTAGMMVGMGFAAQLEPTTANRATQADTASPATLSFDEQLDRLERLKKLLDASVLTQEEFDSKKRKVLGL